MSISRSDVALYCSAGAIKIYAMGLYRRSKITTQVISSKDSTKAVIIAFATPILVEQAIAQMMSTPELSCKDAMPILIALRVHFAIRSSQAPAGVPSGEPGQGHWRVPR